MPIRLHSFIALLFASLGLAGQAAGQRPSASPDTTHAGHALPKPVWRDRVRYGGGPSVGAPPSSFNGKVPPSQWCLVTDAPGSADLSHGTSWRRASLSWLSQVLSDTSSLGQGWRKVLGGAPKIAERDSTTLVEVKDETTCRRIAEVINRDVLGWEVGPPPVAVVRVGDFFVAHPANAWLGEFGYAVGMSMDFHIRGVATW